MTTTPQPLTRKPIPTTYRVWYRELLGLLNMLDSLPQCIHDNGNPWVTSMDRYTRHRIDDLLRFQSHDVKAHIRGTGIAYKNNIYKAHELRKLYGVNSIKTK